MDVVGIALEDQYAEAHPDSLAASHDHSNFKSIYENCVDALHKATTPDPETGKQDRRAMRFFSYDRLAPANVAAFTEVGGWDTSIPFYMTDCDMHARLEMAGLELKSSRQEWFLMSQIVWMICLCFIGRMDGCGGQF